MDSDSVKKNIRRIRKELNMTQQEMADRIGISRTAFRQIENGRTKLFSDHLSAIARLSGRSEEECLLGFNPWDVNGENLREQENLKEKIKELTAYYEEKIGSLTEMLEIKDEAIRTLKDINNRLSSQLDKNV